MWRIELRRAAERQHGVVGRDTTSKVGATPRQLERELSGPDWEKVHLGAWKLVGSVDTPHQRVMAGMLADGPGAVTSHHTAAWLWEFPGFDPLPVHLARIRGTNGSAPDDIIVHRLRSLPTGQITDCRGWR